MKFALLALPCLCCSVIASAELKKLDGIWRPVSSEIGANRLPRPLLEKMVLILRGGKYDYDEGHGHDVGVMREVGTKPPLGIDIVVTKGPNKGRKIKAIYEYDGNMLTICYGLSGQRPQSLNPQNMRTIMVVTYRRAAK